MSLISTYNSIKNLLVTKLTNKGITNASTSQGMTTLINKIDDIETTIPTTLTADFSGTYPPNVDVPFDIMLKSNFTNDDNVSINTPLVGADIDFYIDNTLDDTITTNNNGLSSYVLNISKKDTYTIKAKFEESIPFAGAIISGTVTIFESIIKYFQNISFTNSDGTNSREVIYGNNQSVTMTVQSFEEDNITPSQGSQVDYLIFTEPIITTSYEDAYQLTPHYENYWHVNNEIEDGIYIVPFTTYDIDDNDQMTFLDDNNNPKYVIYYSRDNYLVCVRRGTSEQYSIENKIKIKNNALTITTLSGTEYTFNSVYSWICHGKSPYIIQKEITTISYDEEKIITVLNDNQGLSSYEYESQGIGEIYIQAQSHDDPTIQTDPYLISDWVKKDFTNVGNWIAFTGRVNTFSSNTNDVFTQGNGSKGGVHSQNTVFHLPNDDYIVSFKVNNGTIGAGVRVGLHSASYDDHHEKAVIGIENDSSGGFKFDYSTSEVTTVTKITTGVTKLNTNDLIEFRVVDDTVTFYINGTSYGSATLDWLHTPIWLYGQSWSSNNGNFSIKEFRVKRI